MKKTIFYSIFILIFSCFLSCFLSFGNGDSSNSTTPRSPKKPPFSGIEWEEKQFDVAGGGDCMLISTAFAYILSARENEVDQRFLDLFNDTANDVDPNNYRDLLNDIRSLDLSGITTISVSDTYKTQWTGLINRLRKKLADFMGKNKSMFQNFFSPGEEIIRGSNPSNQQSIIPNSYEEYLIEIGKPFTYLGDIELLALNLLLDYPIRLDIQDVYRNPINTRNFKENQNNKNEEPIILVYNNPHYNFKLKIKKQ